MSSSDATQIAVAVVLTLTLLAVVYYAKQANRQAEGSLRQAEASLKMAEEMREARHGGVLPVVDFVLEPLDGSEQLKRVFQIKAGHLPETQWGALRNIGLGPALDIRFPTKLGDMGPSWPVVGHLGIGEVAKTELSGLERWPFCLEPISDSVKRLHVEYRDAYGRVYESWRDVTFDIADGGWETGPLHTTT